MHWSNSSAASLRRLCAAFRPHELRGALNGTKQKLKEGTLTLGYMPAKNYEFRIEGRYDTSDQTGSTDFTQAWLQALYKF